MADDSAVYSAKVKGYRAGETLPLEFSKARILDIASGLNVARAAGMPERGITDYTKKVLLEGREDAGTNSFNIDNPRANALYEATVAGGANNISASYAAAILDKSEVAKRLNIPFELAWNGTGRTKGGKADGQRHAARAEKFNEVEKDPRNADLVSVVQRGISGDLSPKDRILMLSNTQLTESSFGKLIDKRDGKDIYTKEALATADSALNARIAQLVPADREAVTKELGGYFKAGQLLQTFGDYYKETSGVGSPITDSIKNRKGMGYKVEPRSAGYTAIMDSIVGKDPDMSAYKAATAQRFPPTAPPESAMDAILSAVKSLF